MQALGFLQVCMFMRANTALQLQHDFGVNLAGIALALQLPDEIKSLRMRLNS